MCVSGSPPWCSLMADAPGDRGSRHKEDQRPSPVSWRQASRSGLPLGPGKKLRSYIDAAACRAEIFAPHPLHSGIFDSSVKIGPPTIHVSRGQANRRPQAQLTAPTTSSCRSDEPSTRLQTRRPWLPPSGSQYSATASRATKRPLTRERLFPAGAGVGGRKCPGAVNRRTRGRPRHRDRQSGLAERIGQAEITSVVHKARRDAGPRHAATVFF